MIFGVLYPAKSTSDARSAGPSRVHSQRPVAAAATRWQWAAEPAAQAVAELGESLWTGTGPGWVGLDPGPHHHQHASGVRRRQLTDVLCPTAAAAFCNVCTSEQPSF